MQSDLIFKNLEKLIELGKYKEADELNEHLGLIYGKTSRYFSIKSVILILMKKNKEAENLICECLNKNIIDSDLLHNLIWLSNQSQNIDQLNKSIILQRLMGYNVENEICSNEKGKSDFSVLLGTMEIANQMGIQSKALKSMNVKATTVNYYENYLKFKSDISIDVQKFSSVEEADISVKHLSSELILDYNIFHFHFGTTLTLDGSDLPIIKELNKKMIMQYWGSDVRLLSIAKKLNPYTKVKQMNEDIIKRNLEFHSKYISDCFVDYELYEYVKGYYKNVHVTRSSIDLERFDYVNSSIKVKDKILIVHAPTSPEFKGTQFIVKAIEALNYRGDFEFKLVMGMSNEEAVKIYKEADLIIDQLHTGTYGIFAVESMALGKPVISWISDFMREKLPKELPIVVANPDTIKSVLKNLLDNKDELGEIGRKSRLYVEKYHDSKKVAQEHLEIYKSL